MCSPLKTISFSFDLRNAQPSIKEALELKPVLTDARTRGLRLSFTTVLFYLSLDSAKGNLWDLLALDWVQKKAECMRFCIGRSVTPSGQLPVSADIEYEFSSRNAYNFLQVTYYKVGSFAGSTSLLVLVSSSARIHSPSRSPRQLEKVQKAAAAAQTFFIANPSHLEMRNNIEKYRRMDGVTQEDFQDREIGNERHWVGRIGGEKKDKWD